MNNNNRLMSVRDTALSLGCSVATVWRWSSDGTIPKPLKIGGTTRWMRSDIEGVISAAAHSRAAE